MSVDVTQLSLAKSRLKKENISERVTQEGKADKPAKCIEHEELSSSLAKVGAFDSAIHFANIENWYHLLNPKDQINLTPATQFQAVSEADARTIMSIYQFYVEYQRSRKFKHKLPVPSSSTGNTEDKNSQSKSEGTPPVTQDSKHSEAIVDFRSVLPPQLLQQFERLVAALGSSLDAVKRSALVASCPYVFVKTSSRSAKNNAKDRHNFVQQYRDEYEAWKANEIVKNESQSGKVVLPRADRVNGRIQSLVRAATYGMAFHIDNPEEILSILCKSQRIHDDFDSALEYRASHQEVTWIQNIVLREWVPFNPLLEFRCFIYCKKLRAISQYTTMIHSDIIVKLKQQIHKKIVDIVSEAQKRLDTQDASVFHHYVLDIGFLDPPQIRNRQWKTASKTNGPSEFNVQIPDEEFVKEAQIIEINPYYFTTHGALFEWNDPDDNELLTSVTYERDHPAIELPVFKIIEKLDTEKMMQQMDAEWRSFVRDVDLGDSVDE